MQKMEKYLIKVLAPFNISLLINKEGKTATDIDKNTLFDTKEEAEKFRLNIECDEEYYREFLRVVKYDKNYQPGQDMIENTKALMKR